jgi:hypothetical protein
VGTTATPEPIARGIFHRQVSLERAETLDRSHVQPGPLEELAAHPPPLGGSAQQRRELRLASRLDAGEELRRDHCDTRVSVARRGCVADRAGVEREVSRRMVRRIANQHEMREPLAGRHAQQARQVDLAIDVAVHHQEGLRPEQPARQRHAARGLQRLRFARVGDAQAVARAVAEALDDALAEVRDVDHHLATAGRGEALQVPADQRLAAGLDERLGDAVGERAQPLAAPRGEDHRFHCNSSSSRASGASAP